MLVAKSAHAYKMTVQRIHIKLFRFEAIISIFIIALEPYLNPDVLVILDYSQKYGHLLLLTCDSHSGLQCKENHTNQIDEFCLEIRLV